MEKEKQHRSLPLFWQLLIGVTACWVLLLGVALSVTLHYTLITFQSHVDDILMSTVVTLGNAPEARRSLEAGKCTDEFITYLDDVVENTSDLEYITIADGNSVRIYHVDPLYIGQKFLGGDEQRALGGECYLSDADAGEFGAQRRAFCPVRDLEGGIIGFVMAAASYNRIEDLRAEIYQAYLHIGLMLAILTLLACGMLAMYLGRNLRGVRPDDLIKMYLTQNAILNSLEEGLISFDNTGRVRLVNGAAERMLGHREELLLDRHVDSLILGQDGRSFIGREKEGYIQSNHPNVLVLPVRLPHSKLWSRQVLILGDKSEIMRYVDELGGTRHMVNALRANNHEFLNKLQVISGLLQMGYVEEAQSYIGGISAVHEHIVGPVMRLIRNANVAALILGKAVNLQELDIDMILLSNSTLPERSRYLSTTELVTVVGNLLENAMEATDAIPQEDLRTVALQITEDDKGLLIMVSDTGEGIGEEQLPRLFDSGFSTKAARGRGVGMKLIKEIVDRHGGSIDVDTEPGSGTTFTLIFSRERGGTL